MRKLLLVVSLAVAILVALAWGGAQTRSSQELRAEVEKYVLEPCYRMAVQKLRKAGKLEALGGLTTSQLLELVKHSHSHSSEPLIKSTLQAVEGENRATRHAFYRWALDECTAQAEQVIAGL